MTQKSLVEKWRESAGRIADLTYAALALSGDDKHGRVGVIQRIVDLLAAYYSEEYDVEDMVAVLACRVAQEDGPSFTATSLNIPRVSRLLERGALPDEMWFYERWYQEVVHNLHGHFTEQQTMLQDIEWQLSLWLDGYRTGDSSAQHEAWGWLQRAKDAGKPVEEEVLQW